MSNPSLRPLGARVNPGACSVPPWTPLSPERVRGGVRYIRHSTGERRAPLLGLALLALTAGGACTTGPSAPSLGIEQPVPLVWKDWYEATWQACGRTLRRTPAHAFASLRFYEVAGDAFEWEGRSVLGLWDKNRIYIAASVWGWPVVVRHEMLHAQHGAPGHPPVFAYCDSLAAGLR